MIPKNKTNIAYCSSFDTLPTVATSFLDSLVPSLHCISSTSPVSTSNHNPLTLSHISFLRNAQSLTLFKSACKLSPSLLWNGNFPLRSSSTPSSISGRSVFTLATHPLMVWWLAPQFECCKITIWEMWNQESSAAMSLRMGLTRPATVRREKIEKGGSSARGGRGLEGGYVDHYEGEWTGWKGGRRWG